MFACCACCQEVVTRQVASCSVHVDAGDDNICTLSLYLSAASHSSLIASRVTLTLCRSILRPTRGVGPMRVSTCRGVLSRAIVVAWQTPLVSSNPWMQCSARFLHSPSASSCRFRFVQVATPQCVASYGVSTYSIPRGRANSRRISRAASPSQQRHAATAVQEESGSATAERVRLRPQMHEPLHLVVYFALL